MGLTEGQSTRYWLDHLLRRPGRSPCPRRTVADGLRSCTVLPGNRYGNACGDVRNKSAEAASYCLGIRHSMTNAARRRGTTETSLLCKRYNFHIRSPCINPLQKMEVQKPHLSNGWHVSLLTTWQDPRRALPTQNQRKLRRNFASWKDFLFLLCFITDLQPGLTSDTPTKGRERDCTGGGASPGPGSAANCLCDSQRIF